MSCTMTLFEKRNVENGKVVGATVEPKIPQVKQDVFEEAPPEYRLTDDVYAFYAARLEQALHRLFHPPPEGMAENIFITDRNDRSAQIRVRLETGNKFFTGCH